MILTYHVKNQDEGRKIYHILRNELDISATLVRRLKHTEAIKLDDAIVYTDRLVLPGQKLTVDLSMAEPPCDVVPESGQIDVLYENDGLLALNKPSGMIVHPSHSRYTGTLANYAAGYLLRTTGDGTCHSVGRLDRDTSGVVVFAKNSYMKYRTAKAAAEGEKRYLGIVVGNPKIDSGIMDFPIRREREGDMRRIVSDDGQKATTRFTVLSRCSFSDYTVALLELFLETGRTHQIRVHCAHMGMPLLGDHLYGTQQSISVSEALGFKDQALHALSISFADPLSELPVTITAPVMRSNFLALIEKMGVSL